MKKMVALALISVQWLCFGSPSLDHKIESEHFHMFYAETDASIAPSLFQKAEQAYAVCSKDFQYSFDKPIDLFVYPSVEAHHLAINMEGSPDWLVARADGQTIHIVSPLNPGSCHTKKSLKMLLQLQVAKSFILNQFGKESLPRWLVFGTAAKKGGYFIKAFSPRVPSLEELETSDTTAFAKVSGFQWSYLFVSYIEQKYGWDKLLHVLANYEKFDEIMGLSPKALYQQWLDSAGS